MLRVVADTNVISALNFGGVPDEVLELARRGQIELFISKPILTEIGLLKRKFQWPRSRTQEAITTIREFARNVEPIKRVSVIQRDQADNRVLECAVAAEAKVVISGDSHLRDLGSFEGVRILSPTEFLKQLDALA